MAQLFRALGYLSVHNAETQRDIKLKISSNSKIIERVGEENTARTWTHLFSASGSAFNLIFSDKGQANKVDKDFNL